MNIISTTNPTSHSSFIHTHTHTHKQQRNHPKEQHSEK